MISTQMPTIAEIEASIDVLLREAIADDQRQPNEPLVIQSVADFADMPVPTRAEIEIRRLARQPIGGACRNAIRRLGEHLFGVLGTIDAMREVSERVADMEPARIGKRLNIIDHAWDGIGSDTERWWA